MFSMYHTALQYSAAARRVILLEVIAKNTAAFSADLEGLKMMSKTAV